MRHGIVGTETLVDPAACAAGFSDDGEVLWQRHYQPGEYGRFFDVAWPMVYSDANGFAQHQLDPTAPPAAAGQITSGDAFYFQHWYRDPAEGPSFFNLSNGLAATFCP